jgi:hypothetical protein
MLAREIWTKKHQQHRIKLNEKKKVVIVEITASEKVQSRSI